MKDMKFLCWLLILLWTPPAFSNCVGRFVNPITDIFWKCLFPITIAGMKVASGFEDTSNPSNPVCFCKGARSGSPPRIGIPISFWEPVRLIDITRTPYCMVNLGGVKMGPQSSTQGRGTVGHASKGHMKQSFYQVHWYVYPLIYWLELLVDFVCLEKATFDVAYITELDPLWNDDETSFIINPEAALFGNPIAQAACAADCAAASLGFSHDALFWCAGCQAGVHVSLYRHRVGPQWWCSSFSPAHATVHGETASRGTAVGVYRGSGALR